MMFLSQSEIAAWTRCPRMWFVGYYLGFQPADEPVTGHRQLGIRIHTALEGHYGYQLDPLTVLGLLYQLEISAHPEAEQELKSEMGLALIMVSGYLEWAESEGKDADLRVVATEADVQVPLPGLEDKVILRCRMDQVVQSASEGHLSFLDHKSVGSFEKHEYLELDPQFRFYSLVQILAAGHRVVPGEPIHFEPGRPAVDGAFLNSLRRVKRTGSSQPPYYQRDPFRYSVSQIGATLNRTRQVALEILNARAQLSQVYAAGGTLDGVNWLQQTLLRPNPILGDCGWRCPLSSGTCQAMDDGSDWPGILERSGRFVRADPYARYSEDPLRSVREKIAGL